MPLLPLTLFDFQLLLTAQITRPHQLLKLGFKKVSSERQSYIPPLSLELLHDSTCALRKRIELFVQVTV